MKTKLLFFILILSIAFSCNSDKVSTGQDKQDLLNVLRHTKVKELKAESDVIINNEPNKTLEQRSTLCEQWAQYTGMQDCCYVGAYLSSPANCKLKLEWYGQNCFKPYVFHCWIYKCNNGSILGHYTADKDPCYSSYQHVTYFDVPAGSYYILYMLADVNLTDGCGLQLNSNCVTVKSGGQNCVQP